jgi:hypothetical protein
LIVVGGIHGDGVEVWALSLEKQDSNWQLLPLLPTQRFVSKQRQKERETEREIERKRDREKER